MKTFKWLLVPLALSVTAPAWADPPSGAPSGHPGGRSKEKMQEMRSHMLRERVGLTEEKAKRVEAILDKYAPERKRSHEALRDAREDLRALVESKSEDENLYKKMLGDVRAKRKAMQDLMDRAFNDVAKELTPSEQARLFLSLEEMHGFGRGHGPGFGHGRGPGGPSGPGGPPAKR